MKRAVLACLILAGLAWAQPTRKVAMVLKVRGAVSNHSAPVLTGQLWSTGDSIELAPGAQVTVLLLNRGERREISGKGWLEVAPEGLKLHGNCAAKVLSSTQLKVALNGENHRQIAGMVLRGAIPVANSLLDQIETEPGGVKISRAAEAGSPPSLKFCYSSKYLLPILSKDLTRVQMPPLPKPAPGQSIEVAGQSQDGRWSWDLPWPSQGPPARALEVFDPSGTRLLYTRVYQPSSEEQSELNTARQEVADWEQREPGTIEPSVYQANLLEEMGQLQAALKALQPALTLQPQDQGLMQMKARLLMDLGRYADAAEAVKTAQN